MSVSVTEFEKRHLDDVMKISTAELGELYQKPEIFLDGMNDENVIVYVAEENGKVVGFERNVVFGPEKIDEILKLPDSEERDFLSQMKTIMLLDSASILDSEKGKGIGTALVKKAIESRKCDAYVSMAWKSVDGTINADGLLKKFNFKPTELEIKGYWNLMVEEPEGHHCPVCGAPCKCSAVLYILTDMRTGCP